jgi:hypothetical protein
MQSFNESMNKEMSLVEKVNAKKFVRYKEGAELYSMCQSKFERLAKDAKAIYKVNKVVLVNLEILDEYLGKFRIVE